MSSGIMVHLLHQNASRNIPSLKLQMPRNVQILRYLF